MAKKKNVPIEDTNANSLDVVREHMKNTYKVTYHTMGDLQRLPAISTGCLGLDTLLAGGFARGKVYEIFGPYQGGKTTLAISTIINAQKQGLRSLFVDAEHGANSDLFEIMGVDIHALEYVALATAEANIDSLKRYMREESIALAVIDSVSGLVPTSEADSDMADQFMGLHARFMGKTMRVLTPLAFETNTTLIFINQIRYKLNPYGNPTTTTGGEALKFFTSARIEVAGITKDNRLMDANGNSYGHKTKFTIEKNRFSPPSKAIEVPLIYGVGYDTITEVLHMSTNFEFITQKGAYYYFSGEEKAFAQGESNAVRYLYENQDVYKTLKYSVVEKLGLKEAYEKQSIQQCI